MPNDDGIGRRHNHDRPMNTPRYPSLYQINTRVWLTRLSQTLGRTATLDDIPDGDLDRLAARGFDWIWLLSVWRTGSAAQQIGRHGGRRLTSGRHVGASHPTDTWERSSSTVPKPHRTD
jgi:hypothetical protein